MTDHPHPLELPALSITDIVRYAGASGDFNPIHHDSDLATAAGQPGVFAMGMLTAGIVTPHVEDIVAEGGRVEMRFLDRVWPGHPLTMSVERGEDRATAEVSSNGRPVLQITAHRGDGDADSASPEGTLLADPYEWVVEQGAVRAFREATRTGDVPFGPGAAAPAIFAVTAQRWRNSQADLIDQVGFDVTRMLHGSSSFELVGGPLIVGDTFEVREIKTPVTEKVGRRGGRMRSVDIVTEVRTHANELRCRATTRLLELEAPAAPPADDHPFLRLDPPRLLGSHDELTGETYFPPRELSVDGRLRALRTVELAPAGVLYSWTEIGGVGYGQIDLPEGVRVQAPLGDGPHVIGDRYTLEASATGEGTMRWGYHHD
ncbi:MaoC/PaaZ C-terminal domain-containing protein [Streptomyces sp. NPDC055078]